MLDKYLPDDLYIYVKENPKQKKWGRSIEFYKELNKLKKVKLISKKEDAYKLLGIYKAVATLTFTAGWEAFSRNKPVLLFGDIYYQYADGAFQAKTNKELKNALNEIINLNYKPDIVNRKLYLKAFKNLTYTGYYNQVYITNNVSKEENSLNLFNVLKQNLD